MMIREATRDDLNAVLSLYHALFTEMALLDPERMRPAE